jgi:putative transposase
MLQEEYESLRKKYWGQHLWSAGYFCRTVGAVTDDMIKEYIENQADEGDESFKIVDDDA